ncbi:nucleotide-diphospho-sugar transferase [Talaromyces proteolyticus]|uniref:Nucleotide-diphospho-sugar transferase n=1 Tax=Talaromyces proteolyticus TaxID=1131652 RepID=A0AAD4Q2R8_9EURO|nr:nucleotide-diphospho-sugar transferase [Talaromyces proteolyticus]KAH8703967.1 nucleotide-diphospho-sugar transferase [Talaromyces proteolyticus]
MEKPVNTKETSFEVTASSSGASQLAIERGTEKPTRSGNLYSSLKKLFHDVVWTFNTASDGVQDWTPFFLVLSYFVFSTTIYMNATSGIMKVFWFLYLMTNTYIASATVIEAVMSTGAFHDAKKTVEKVAKKNWQFPTLDSDLLKLDIIIVAYLPNEQDIVMDRVTYLLEEIIYPRDKLRINLIYNTPYAIQPLEDELHELARRNPGNLRVIKVPNSTSKADNINYYCMMNGIDADVSAIFDCDHYPHPYAPRWAMERFAKDKSVDIVQGRCVILNANDNLMTSMIGIEFDKIYAVSHPGRAAMFNFGLFCGSNGYWRTSLLRELKMDDTMLTEDIDSALRAFGRGANAVHDLNVTSFELAPVTMSAFWKQRLRWSQGWVQASFRHMHLVWSRSPDSSKHRSLRQRFGILSLLFVRELSYYLITQYLCLVFSIVIIHFPKSGHELYLLLFFQYPVAWWLFLFSLFSFVGTLYVTLHFRSEFTRWYSVPIFAMSYPIQLVLTATLGLFGHARQVSKYVKWNPTPRG